MRSEERQTAGLAGLAVLACLVVSILAPSSTVSLVILVLLLSSIASASPMSMLLATVAVLPFFYRPIQFGTVEFAASELTLLAALVGTVARIGLDLSRGSMGIGGLGRLISDVRRSRLVWFLVVITLAAMVATIFVFEPSARSASLRELRWSFVQPLIFVVLLTVVGRTPNARVMLCAGLIAAGSIAAGHALIDVVAGGGVLADNVRRISGPFPHPNALALFLVRPLALATALALLLPRWRAFALPPLALIAIATFGTFSRGAMLAAVALVLMLALHSSRRTQLAMAGSVAAMGALTVLVAGERMHSAFGGGSVSLRIDIWTSSIRMIRDSPITGYGPDQFLYAYAPRYILPTAWDERFTSHAHNLIADSWIRVGIIGAVAACVGLIVVAHRVVTTRNVVSIETAATIALAATLVHGLVDNAYFGHDLAMSVWLLAWVAFDRTRNDEAVFT